MRHCFLLMWVLLGCSDNSGKDESGDVTPMGGDDTAEVGDVVDDTAEDDTGPSLPPVPGMPAGLWRDCRGSLGLYESGEWSWRDAGTTCTAEGMAVLEDGLLTLSVSESSGCEGGVPWWMNGEGDAPGVHTFSATDIRLTLVPEVAIGSSGSASHREKHFYGQLFRERWLLTNDDGQSSHFDACFSPERVFFEGRYQAVDGECDFLSCGGSINDWRRVETGQLHIWTQCAGGCPCAGVLQTSEFGEVEMAGVYGYTNCATSGTGSFTGTKVAFPTADER